MVPKYRDSDVKLIKVELTKQELVEVLKTREYRLTEDRKDSMFVSKKRVKSEAWRALKTPAAYLVYTLFMTKCKVEQVPERPMSSQKKWIIANNGEIQFSYKEAGDKWGISNGVFTRAIDELIRVGLIDIIHSANGLHQDVTLYAISDRWRKFGTDGFVVKERQKRKVQYGFAKGNEHGKNSGKKQSQHLSVTVEQQLPVTVDAESEVQK